MAFGLLLIRLVIGLTLAIHGTQKLFGWFDGPGLKGFAGWLGSMGIRAPLFAAFMAAMMEFAGGLMFAAGLLTPLAAVAVITVMTTAILTVHLKAGFFASNGGYEFNLVLLLVAAGIAATGAGSLSIDHLLNLTGAEYSGWMWGVGALLVGFILAVGNLATRKKIEAPSADAA